MHSPSCTSARPVRSPATHAPTRPPSSVSVSSRGSTGVPRRRHREPTPRAQACSPAPEHSGVQCREHRGSGPIERRSRLGGAPRIPTVTGQSGGRRLRVWKGHGSILEAFHHSSSNDPGPYLPTIWYGWYWPHLDPAGYSFFFFFLVFLLSPSLSHWLTPPPPKQPCLLSTPAPLWLEFLTCPKPRPFPSPKTRASSQGFRPHGHQDWFLACTRLQCPLRFAYCSMSRVVRACVRACRPPSIVAFRVLDRLTQQKLMHSIYNHLAPCPATTPLHTPLADTNYIRTVHGPRSTVHGGEVFTGRCATPLTIPARRSLNGPPMPRYSVTKYRSP